MFGDMFQNEDELLEQAVEESQGGMPDFVRKRGAHCACDLDLPPQQRQDSKFVGLWNQGATCYLNSLFQTLYLTPQFRDFMYQLPLSEPTDIAEKWQIAPKKFGMLRALQDLFASLQSSNIRATSTVPIGEAFGWESENNDGCNAYQQHDVAESTRVLFDALEQCLYGTQYDSAIEELFFGVQNSVINCHECGESRIRQAKFLELGLQVKGLKGVRESLKELFSFE